MGPTPVYGARAEKPLQNADFAMKQTNICRLSGDITKWQRSGQVMYNNEGRWNQIARGLRMTWWEYIKEDMISFDLSQNDSQVRNK